MGAQQYVCTVTIHVLAAGRRIIVVASFSDFVLRCD